MSVRQLGGLLGALGGLVWIARWLQAPSQEAADLMRYVGLGLVLLGLVCVGLTLVKGQARWLDFVIGFSIPALFWAIYELVRGTGQALEVHGALGVAWVVVGGALLVRGGHRDDWDEEEYEEYEDGYGQQAREQQYDQQQYDQQQAYPQTQPGYPAYDQQAYPQQAYPQQAYDPQTYGQQAWGQQGQPGYDQRY